MEFLHMKTVIAEMKKKNRLNRQIRIAKEILVMV